MSESWSSWIDEHPLGEASTVCAATGVTVEQALDAYGADLGRRREWSGGEPDWRDGASVWVLGVAGGVLAVEPNGFQGSRVEVLRRLGQVGRAASCYRSVNILPYLSFVESGQLLAQFETIVEPAPQAGPVADVLEGIDLDDYRAHWGLRVLQRFTGHALDLAVFDRMLTEGHCYNIVPHLAELVPRPIGPDGQPIGLGEGNPLGAEVNPLLRRLSGEQLREIAWWAAEQVVMLYQVEGDPAIARTLASRTLDDTAIRLARARRLSDGRDNGDANLWGCLYGATNPDPFAAAVSNLSTADYVFYTHPGPHQPSWPDRARSHLDRYRASPA